MSCHKSPVTDPAGVLFPTVSLAFAAKLDTKPDTFACAISESAMAILSNFSNPLSVWAKSSSNIRPVTAWTDVFSTVMMVTVFPDVTPVLN